MNKTERLKLIDALNNLPLELFNEVAFALEPPYGVIPPSSAAQGDRTFALLGWAESGCGCGLHKVQEILGQVMKTESGRNAIDRLSPQSNSNITIGRNAVKSIINTGNNNLLINIGIGNRKSVAAVTVIALIILLAFAFWTGEKNRDGPRGKAAVSAKDNRNGSQSTNNPANGDSKSASPSSALTPRDERIKISDIERNEDEGASHNRK